jgi:hypothetical protein
MKGPFLGWFVGIVVPVQENFVLVAPSRSITNIFVLTVHHFNSFVPIAQQAVQAVVLGRLSLSMCL